MKLKKVLLPMVCALLLGSAITANAEELTGTLQSIKDNGVVVVGHRESSIPFSYYNLKQEAVGYSQEYSELIVQAIKDKLDMPDLIVKYIPITSQNRIPLLQNGTYDFECGSTTNSAARQQQVDFSNSIFIVGTRLLVSKNSGINDFADLKGKSVAVTSGTTSEILIHNLNDSANMGMTVISVKDHGDAFRMVESGRAVAFFIDDALLAGERAKSKNPANWEIVGTPQSYEAYGCMSRKGDEPFLSLINDSIATSQKDGRATAFFEKWFLNPIPPKNMNLNFEMSDELKELFKNPNSKAF